MNRHARTASGPSTPHSSGGRSSVGSFWNSSLPTIVVALFASLVLQYFARQPLWHTDVWGHLAYGRWMTDHGRLPSVEPFLPWDGNSRFVDTAWLSQWFGFQIFRRFGVGGIQLLYAGSIALATALLAQQISRKSGTLVWGLVGAAVFLALDWEQLKIVRPQLAGLICFVLLLSLVLMPKRRGETLLVAILFTAWANLHGSFAVGLAVLVLICLGQFVGDWLNRHNVNRERHPQLRRYLTLLGIASLATLVNPYGPWLHVEVWCISAHPNLSDLIEWKPLHEHARQSVVVAAVAAFSIALFAGAFTKGRTFRREYALEGLIAASLLAATLWKSRMILWWGPAAGWMIGVVAASCWKNPLPVLAADSSHHSREWKALSIGAVILGVACLFTPAGLALVTGKPQRFDATVSTATPIGACEYLLENPPTGQIFNPMEWGDYLVWSGPANLKIFANSHVHLIPPEIWQDYMSVISGGAEVPAILDRHDVDVVVTDPNRQRALIELLRKSGDWQSAFEDDRSIVFTRLQPTK